MKRWLWRMVWGMSLLISVLCAALWVRSYFLGDALAYENYSAPQYLHRELLWSSLRGETQLL